MDNSALKITQAKELRGAIVLQLYDVYGERTALSTVKKLLKYKGYYTDKDIRRAVHYLSSDDRNYIDIETGEDDYWDSPVSLTPAGVNLVEGDVEDAGVILDE